MRDVCDVRRDVCGCVDMRCVDVRRDVCRCEEMCVDVSPCPSSCSKDIVEPLLKPQWYVKCDEMAAKAVEVRGVWLKGGGQDIPYLFPRLFAAGSLASFLPSMIVCGTPGWRTAVIGAYLASFGGDIAFLHTL